MKSSHKVTSDLPIDRDRLLALIAVEVFHMTVFNTIFMETLGDLDIVAAVFSDLGHLSLLPPADGIETVGDFSRTEGSGGERFEFEAMPDPFFNIEQNIEAPDLLLQFPDGVAHED